VGKEAKVGLAIVGVLMLVFAVLLVRRFVPFEAMLAGARPASDDRAEAPNDHGVKPTIVTVQKDSRDHASSDREAEVEPRDIPPAAESHAEMPKREFMPRDSAQGRLEPNDRYHQDQPPVADADEVPAADSNPFQHPGARHNHQADSSVAPRELGDEPQDAQALEDHQPRGRAPGNRLRRLSAEVPADEVPASDEPARPAVDAQLNTIEVPSANDDATAPGLETESPAEASEAGPRVPVDRSARPRWRQESPAARQVEPAVAPPEAPRVLAENGKYTIQPNDSLWLISEKVYGTGGYFKAIFQHNRNKLPRADQLTVGAVIAVPPASVLEENYPALCPKQRKSVMVQPRAAQASPREPVARGGDVYTVEAGDTLFDIARYELGKASRWGEIYELNREVLGQDFDYLQPGTQLRMPPHGSRADTIAREPDRTYQR
jgi:nucleoid-associated protein YgaU